MESRGKLPCMIWAINKWRGGSQTENVKSDAAHFVFVFL